MSSSEWRIRVAATVATLLLAVVGLTAPRLLPLPPPPEHDVFMKSQAIVPLASADSQAGYHVLRIEGLGSAALVRVYLAWPGPGGPPRSYLMYKYAGTEADVKQSHPANLDEGRTATGQGYQWHIVAETRLLEYRTVLGGVWEAWWNTGDTTVRIDFRAPLSDGEVEAFVSHLR